MNQKYSNLNDEIDQKLEKLLEYEQQEIMYQCNKIKDEINEKIEKFFKKSNYDIPSQIHENYYQIQAKLEESLSENTKKILSPYVSYIENLYN